MGGFDQGHDYILRPNAVRTVHPTKVEILSYRPTKFG